MRRREDGGGGGGGGVGSVDARRDGDFEEWTDGGDLDDLREAEGDLVPGDLATGMVRVSPRKRSFLSGLVTEFLILNVTHPVLTLSESKLV